MTRFAPTLIRTLGTFLSCCVVAYALYNFGADLKVKAIAEAEGATWVAYHAKEAERWRAIQKNIELEAKRTTVQTEIRGMVMAELRRCRKGACK